MKTKNAANSKFLNGVKRSMNGKIYSHTRAIVNAQGEEEAIVYLQQFFSVAIDFNTFTKHASLKYLLGGK